MTTAGAGISTNTAIPSATGPNSPSSVCSPAAPALWAFSRLLHLTGLPTPHTRFFCQSCQSKACSCCGLKSTEQQPICSGRFLTTTGPCSTTCFTVSPAAACRGSEDRWHRYLHTQHRRTWKVHFAKRPGAQREIPVPLSETSAGGDFPTLVLSLRCRMTWNESRVL